MAALMRDQEHLGYLPQALSKLDPVFAGLRSPPLAMKPAETEL